MTMKKSEEYMDIVWNQFKKNRFARQALIFVLVFFLVAIFAPLVASNQPFCFREDGRLHFPWLVSLFNPETFIDFIFNVAMLIFLPWMIASWILHRRWKGKGLSPRKQILRTTLLFFAILASAVVFFYFVHPPNKYSDRDFKKDHFNGKGTGIYAIIPYGPTEQDLDSIYKRPLYQKKESFTRYYDHERHLLGTDDLGRDVLVRMLYGSRISMTVGFVSVSLYVTIGIIVGALAGYFGGKVDMIISRIIEIVLLFPAFFLILILVALIGPNIYIIMVVIGVTGWPTIARLIRGEFLRQRASEYVSAAKALGTSDARIMFRHVLPNAVSPAFVAIPFGIAGAVTLEAGLSLLGYGVRPPTPSWGSILYLAYNNYKMWWLILFPGISIFLTVTVYNLVGNGLRDAMDPRLRM